MKIRRFFVSLCILTFAITAFSNAANHLVSVNQATYSLSTVAHDVSNIFPSLYPGLNSSSPLYLGEAIPSYIVSDNAEIRSSEYVSYPILLSNTLVGFADVFGDINSPTVVCRTTSPVPLNSTDSLALVYFDDATYLKKPSGLIGLTRNTSSQKADLIASLNLDSTPLAVHELSLSSENSSRTLNDYIINIPYVRNLTTTEMNNLHNEPGFTLCSCGGLCWAAASAMIHNYYYDSPVHDAKSVHLITDCFAKCYDSLNEEGLTNPSVNDVQRYILSLLYISTEDHFGPTDFTYSNIRNYLNSDKLLMLYAVYQSNNTAHNVVANGCYTYTNTGGSVSYGFYYMDPNSPSLISYPLPSNGVTTVSIPSSGKMYTLRYIIPSYRRAN